MISPEDTGKNYDAIASWWRAQHGNSKYGVAQLERAISFTESRGLALDVGGGSSGRFMRVLQEAGFSLAGMDVSSEMLKHAEQEVTDAHYFLGNIGICELEKKYDFLSAWDSTFHLPLELQEPALKSMCGALNSKGVLIFTCGGVSEPGTISGGFRGEDFEYSSLGVEEYLRLLRKFSCEFLHVEFDQGPSESHVYIIARKR